MGAISPTSVRTNSPDALRAAHVSARLESVLPGLIVSIDPPERPQGNWFFDLNYHGKRATLEWRPSKGFGLSQIPGRGFGAGAEVLETELEKVVERVRTNFINAA